MNPIFSVITITKDNPKDFIYTAETLKSQTYKSFEWIVVDSSTEINSKKTIQKYKNNINNLIISNPNGIANAWNKGIKKASGEFVFILNAGDGYEKNFLKSYLKNIISPNYIYCSKVKLQNSSRTKTVGEFIAKPSALWRGMHIAHCSICIPRRMHKKYGYYPEIKNAMDFALFSKIYKLEGEEIFKVINSSSFARYTLGGHSEINYFQGLYQSRKINIAQGLHPFLAFIIESLYKIKFIVARFIKFFILSK